jgi:hypothetical protein
MSPPSVPQRANFCPFRAIRRTFVADLLCRSPKINELGRFRADCSSWHSSCKVPSSGVTESCRGHEWPTLYRDRCWTLRWVGRGPKAQSPWRYAPKDSSLRVLSRPDGREFRIDCGDIPVPRLRAGRALSRAGYDCRALGATRILVPKTRNRLTRADHPRAVDFDRRGSQHLSAVNG